MLKIDFRKKGSNYDFNVYGQLLPLVFMTIELTVVSKLDRHGFLVCRMSQS